MNLNFLMSELIHSDTAVRYKINNMPDISSLDNMLYLILYCLQPIRDLIGKPITITSGFRTSQLNKILGGANNSQHLKGQAADICIKGLTAKETYEWIKRSGFYYDQLILEYSKGTEWVHISYVKGKNRRENLIYKNGVYELDKK